MPSASTSRARSRPSEQWGDPLVTVQMNTERLQIKYTNINDPLGGLDSGITADILDLYGITQRIILDGWMVTNYGNILVNIPGRRRDLRLADDERCRWTRTSCYNNFIQGVAGVLKTNKPGGVIEIVTTTPWSWKAGRYVNGAGARITILPGTFFELVQIAGAMYAPGDNSLVEIYAPRRSTSTARSWPASSGRAGVKRQGRRRRRCHHQHAARAADLRGHHLAPT